MLICRNIARYRFLSAAQIERTTPGSDDHIGRRVRALFHNGYLDCPPVQLNQLAHVFAVGNFPLVYGLGLKGAQLIASHEPWLNPKLDWTTNNTRVGAPFLAHTIQVADFMIDLHHVAPTAQNTLIDHHQLLPTFPEHNQHRSRSHNPFALRPSIVLPRTRTRKEQTIALGVVPDRLFSLSRDNERKNYAYEKDRGTMDVGFADERTPLTGRASVKRKIVGFWNAWKQDLHATQWSCKAFRVLIDTPSEQRLKNILALQREVTDGGSNLFLLTTPERLKEHSVLGPAWVSGNGDDGVSIAC